MVPVHCISRSQELKIDFLTKNLKNLLVRNHWTDFSIILQKCSFGDPLPRLFTASVAQLDAPSDWRPGGRWFKPRRGRQHSFVEIDHEIFSTVILSLLLIQEGQLSVSAGMLLW